MKSVLRGGCAIAALAYAWPGHAQTFDVPPGETQVQSGQITGAGNSVTVTGGGTLVITNPANSYGGGTTVNAASTVQVGVDGDLGAAAGGITLGDAAQNGTLDLTPSISAVTSGRTITINAGGGSILVGTNPWTLNGVISGGALSVNGGGELVLTNTGNSFSALNIAGNSTVQAATDANLGAPGGLVTLGDAASAGTLDLTTSVGPVASVRPIAIGTGGGNILVGVNPWTLGGVISGGALTVNGGGELVLTNTGNSFSALNILGNSAVQAATDTNLGAANGLVTLGNSVSTGTLDLSTATGPVTSTRLIAIGSAGGTILTGANPWTLGGEVYGGPLSVFGGGELVLATANGFSALNVAGNSTVQAATDADLGIAGGVVTLGGNFSAGTLDFTTATAAVTSTRAYTLNPGGGIFLAGINPWTLTGIISGPGNMTVGGSGTLILSGINTFTGNTSVVGGATLQIDSDTNLGATTNGVVALGDAATTGTLNLSSGGTSARSVALGAAGGTVETVGGAWAFTNTFGGSGSLTIGGTGAVVLDNVETYGGGTTINGGTLMVGDTDNPGAAIPGNVTVNAGGTLAGYGTVTGLVTNNGLVNPGASSVVLPGLQPRVGPLTVGAFTQTATGTTSINITPAGASTLNVIGAANLAGTLNLNYQGNFHSQTVDLINAQTFNGTTFTTVTGALSGAVTQQLLYLPSEIEVMLTQVALPENPTIYPAATTVALNQAQNDNDTVLSRLSDLRTEAVVDQLSMVDDPSHRSGSSSGKSPYGPWFQGVGGFGSITGSGNAPGYNTRGGGFVGGMDVELSNGIVAGAALSYTLSSISESGGASADVDTPRLMLYGGWWHGPIALDASLGVGYASLDSSRPIAQNATNATAAFSGPEVTAALQASSPLHFGPLALTPAIGTDFASLREHRASEGGGGIYDLIVLPSTTNSVRPFIAATASTRFDWDLRSAIEPQLRVAYETEVVGGTRAAVVQPVGDDQLFTIPGVTQSRGILSASAGVKVETDRNLAFFVNVRGMFYGDSRDLGADAGIRYRF